MKESIISMIIGAIVSGVAAIFWGKKKFKTGYARGRVDQVEDIRKQIDVQKKVIEKVDEKAEEIADLEKKDHAEEAERLKSVIPSRELVEQMIKESKE